MKYTDRFFKKSSFLVNSIANLIYDSSELRIINVFKSMAKDYGKEITGLPGIKSVPIQLTNLEIAQLTSTTPKKVKAVIHNLKANGIIRFTDNKLLIKV